MPGIARLRLLRYAQAGIMSMLGVLAFLNVASAAGADSPLYRFAPVPHWVTPVAADNAAPLPVDGVSAGAWDLLLDCQMKMARQLSSCFWRWACF